MKSEKILIHRVSSLGDFIHATPAIKLIKQKNPNAQIYFSSQKKRAVGFVSPNLIPLKSGFIDKFLFYNNNYLSIFLFFLKIINKKFDKLYYFNEFKNKKREKRDYYFFKMSNIKKIYGFNLKGKDTDGKRNDYTKFNETFYLCRTVDNTIKYNQISYSGIFQKIKKIDKKYITISMGGRNINKSWNFENWKILIQKINNNFPKLKIKIVGSKNEIFNANKICQINNKMIINMCGKTTIKSLFKIINSSKFHISHDDGTMHVASACYRPGAVIFGLTAAKGKWRTINKKLKIFYPIKNINETKPNQVFRAIFDVLKKI